MGHKSWSIAAVNLLVGLAAAEVGCGESTAGSGGAGSGGASAGAAAQGSSGSSAGVGAAGANAGGVGGALVTGQAGMGCGGSGGTVAVYWQCCPGGGDRIECTCSPTCMADVGCTLPGQMTCDIPPEGGQGLCRDSSFECCWDCR
jgi:hypothetical protein